jgi:membrane protease YdiL (CAAX protease family)
MEAQVLMLTTAVTLGAVMGGQEVIRSSLALIGNGSATTVLLLPTLASLGLAATTFLLIISFSDWTSRTSDRGASQIGFATSHLAHLLFGRQPALSTVADNDDEASRMTGTLVAVLSIGLLTLLTATCQEISFRGLLLSLISLKLGALGPSVISAAAAVGGQAVAYAAITTPWSTSSPCAADCLSLSFKLLAGLLLGALSLVSHSLYPCIAVQWLSSWYVLTNSWIQANHQMDWVEQQVSPAGSKSDAYTALPSEIRQSLFRFFCAFDSEQRSSLSISDVQRAVSFAFWHAESPPSQEQVLQLTLENYYNKKQDRMTMKPELQNWAENGEYNARLNFDEFLGVMLALRRQSKARWRSQNRTSETT